MAHNVTYLIPTWFHFTKSSCRKRTAWAQFASDDIVHLPQRKFYTNNTHILQKMVHDGANHHLIRGARGLESQLRTKHRNCRTLVAVKVFNFELRFGSCAVSRPAELRSSTVGSTFVATGKVGERFFPDRKKMLPGFLGRLTSAHMCPAHIDIDANQVSLV